MRARKELHSYKVAVEEQRQRDGDFLRRLQRRTELLHRLADGIEDGLFIIGEDLKVQFVNMGARLFFPPITEPVGRPVAECIPDARIMDVITECVESARRVMKEVEVSLPADDALEERVYAVVALPLPPDTIHASDGEILLILRDETEKHKLEKIRRDFVANASHELRTPLSIIIGYLENVLEGDLTETDEIRRAYTVMKKHGDRLAQIVEDLLVISRMESGQPDALKLEDFDLKECAEDVLHRLSPVITQKKASARVDANGSPGVRLRGDPFYWDQILFNLVQNALKENNREGLEVVIGLHEDGNALNVEVRDNGVGIPQADLPYIFKRFYRVVRYENSGVKGTGLGLSIVRRAVEAHQGTISVRSRPGVETVFTIRVPLHLASLTLPANDAEDKDTSDVEKLVEAEKKVMEVSKN
jgi:signal transduction histidine kinase